MTTIAIEVANSKKEEHKLVSNKTSDDCVDDRNNDDEDDDGVDDRNNDDHNESVQAACDDLIKPEDCDEISESLDQVITHLSKAMASALELKKHLAGLKNSTSVYHQTYMHVLQLTKAVSVTVESHNSSKKLSIFNVKYGLSKDQPGFIGWDYSRKLPQDIKDLLPYYSRWDFAYFLSESPDAGHFMDYNAGERHVPAETVDVPNETATKYGFKDGCYLHISRMS
jgi:hypothetical protein